MKVVPDEVYNLIKQEVDQFKNFTSGYIMNQYPLGVSDLVVRFKGHETQILKNIELFQEKHIVNARCRLLASYIEDAARLYPDLFKNLDVILPVCFSDTSDTPLQTIPCLVFSKTAFSNNILIPSPNNLVGHWEVESVNAFDMPLESKLNMMCFIGSFTGNLQDLPNNMRLKMAAKASNDPNFFCRLIRPPKMEEHEFAEVLKECKRLYPELSDNLIVNEDNKIPLLDQLEYKYQICVDGHTCAWARLPWQMKANSVPIKIRNPRHNWKEWFYPLLQPNKHFLEVDIEEVSMAYEYLENNPQARNDINEAGKAFVDKYCSPEMALNVLTQTLLLLNEKQDNKYHVKAELEQQGQGDVRKV